MPLSNHLQNLRTVETGVPGTQLFRSQQPGYNGHEDTVQAFTPEFVRALVDAQVRLIVSGNRWDVTPKTAEALTTQGINYLHLAVEDFQPPSVEQLRSAVDAMNGVFADGRSCLVYCGFGDGRTGTIVSAWEVSRRVTDLPRGPALDEVVEAICDAAHVETAEQRAAVADFGRALLVDLGDPGGPGGSGGPDGQDRPGDRGDPSGTGGHR